MADLTLIEKLRDIERLRPGSEWPEWMKEPGGWGAPLSALAKEAADALELLRPLANLHGMIEEDDAPDSAMFFQHDGYTIDYGDIRKAHRMLDPSSKHARSIP